MLHTSLCKVLFETSVDCHIKITTHPAYAPRGRLLCPITRGRLHMHMQKAFKQEKSVFTLLCNPINYTLKIRSVTDTLGHKGFWHTHCLIAHHQRKSPQSHAPPHSWLNPPCLCLHYRSIVHSMSNYKNISHIQYMKCICSQSNMEQVTSQTYLMP